MRKILIVSIIIYALFIVFSHSGMTTDIMVDLTEIEIISECQDILDSYEQPERALSIQGQNTIHLRGTEEDVRLEIEFCADDPQVYTMMANNLAVQYRLIRSFDEECEWSKWKYLSQFPLTINLNSKDSESNQPSAQIVILLRFRVPATLMIQQGIYHGEFLVKII